MLVKKKILLYKGITSAQGTVAAALYITGSCGKGALLPRVLGSGPMNDGFAKAQLVRDLGTHNMARAIRQRSVSI